MNFPVQAVNLTTAYLQTEKSKHGKHKDPNYYRNYYLKNKLKLLSYGHEYYNLKKLLAPYQKEKKNGVKKFFSSHTRSTLTIIARKDRELFFFGRDGVKKLETQKEKFTRRLDQDYLRLATIDKRPLKRGWTYEKFKEWLTKEQLIKKNQEWSIKGGKKLGNKFLSFLDLDIEAVNLEEWRKKQLRKNVKLLLNYLGCFYVETKKGFHVYLLTDELLPNAMLYHVDKFGNRKVIGSIQSKGKYVVGFDSKDKNLVESGKWFWHDKNIKEVEEKLGKFFIEIGNERKEKTDKYLEEFQKELRQKKVEKKPIEFGYLVSENSVLKQERELILAEVLSKEKTNLEHMWKVFYRDLKTKQKGYFLVNNYQKSYVLPSLEIGNVRNIMLVSGYKHQFFSRYLNRSWN